MCGLVGSREWLRDGTPEQRHVDMAEVPEVAVMALGMHAEVEGGKDYTKRLEGPRLGRGGSPSGLCPERLWPLSLPHTELWGWRCRPPSRSGLRLGRLRVEAGRRQQGWVDMERRVPELDASLQSASPTRRSTGS